jgi:hypothetical protein
MQVTRICVYIFSSTLFLKFEGSFYKRVLQPSLYNPRDETVRPVIRDGHARPLRSTSFVPEVKA